MFDIVLGLFGILIWIVVVVGFAAAVTYLVIRISPADKPKKPEPVELAPEPES
jgi:hypothetical protein